MKKFFSILMVACLIAAATSCNGNGGSNSGSDSTSSKSGASGAEATGATSGNRTFTSEEDSLAMEMGELLGATIKAQLDMDTIARDKLDNEQFRKGFEMIMRCDTSNMSQSFLQGAYIAFKLYEQIAMTESQGININRDKLIESIFKVINSKDALNANDLNKRGQELQKKLMNMAKAKAEANKAAGEKYINEKIKTDSSYTKTPSGAYYKVLKTGEGANFKDSDIIDLVYVAKHIDGKEYDNTNGKKEQYSMNLVPPGLREILKLMKPGAAFIAVVPSNLAYKEQGIGPVQPNETLIFEINSVNIHK